MPCAEFQRLKIKWDLAHETWKQFAYAGNQHTWGSVSKTGAVRIAREEQTKMNELNPTLDWHRLSCPECKRLREAELAG